MEGRLFDALTPGVPAATDEADATDKEAAAEDEAEAVDAVVPAVWNLN